VDADLAVDLEEAGEGHAGEGEGTEGFGEDGGIADFEVAVVEDVHVVFEHGGFTEEVAELGFVVFAGGGDAEVTGIITVAKGIGVAGLTAWFAFGSDDLDIGVFHGVNYGLV
jgi:hypothetical protein